MSAISEAVNAALPEVYYEANSKDYFRRDAGGLFIKGNESSIKRGLKKNGWSPHVPDGAFLSPLDDVMDRIQREQNVVFAGPLAGHDVGLYKINNANILVTAPPRLIPPVEGDWNVLRRILEGMFRLSEIDQTQYVYGWLKIAIQSLRERRWQPGQVLAMAGPVRSGKSLVQSIITELLGGRVAHPYEFMCNDTRFNSDLLGAEHLAIEDVAESVDYRRRCAFGAKLKELTVNHTQRIVAKYQNALTLTPLWRISMSLNDEPERLQVLPPINDDVEDKIILLKVSKCEMPMPTRTGGEQERFWNTIVGELPAFVHFLDQWEIPAGLKSDRFGIRHYHHPDILAALDAYAPEKQLLELIDSVIFGGLSRSAWIGLAIELQLRLAESDHKMLVSRSFDTASKCGTYLARLEDKIPNRVRSRIVHEKKREWTIQPPETNGESRDRDHSPPSTDNPITLLQDYSNDEVDSKAA